MVIDAISVEVTVSPPADGFEEHATASLGLLQAAADPIRWVVLQRLAARSACVCDLQEHIPIAANLLSYHLKVLREAGLVTTSRRGRWVDYALAEDAMERLRGALPGATSVEPVGP